MIYHTILFDLDGTLVNSYEGIAGGISFALEKMGRTLPPHEVLNLFVGPPLGESFQGHCGMTEGESEVAIAYYREYYLRQGLYEMTMYDGILEMLQGLKGAGKRLAVATSKPQPFAVKILEKLNIAMYFDGIAGSGLDGSLGTKAAVIDHCLRMLGVGAGAGVGVEDEDEDEDADVVGGILMVGDREHDVFGAGALGIDCLGVLFGFGSQEELERAGAIAVVSSPAEVLDFVI